MGAEGQAPLVVPRAPGCLRLAVERLWDGGPCPDPRRHAAVWLRAWADGLEVGGSLPRQRPPRVPSAPAGTRVADLFEYDVVECFLGAPDGTYLEVELGAGGHFLVLGFSAPRRRSDAFEDLAPGLCFERDTAGWRSRLLLPWRLVPRPLARLGAFAAAGGRLLAHRSVPGPAPDFHQPARWTPAVLAPDEVVS
jgi:hypothetical protein